jgi:ubiquitin carboxyl-terminal hydrolase 5/13
MLVYFINLAVYCYACNNDVKDPELAGHLVHFGIDISEQKKTEKTMTELNIEINLNFTLSKQIEEGKVLTPIYGAGYTGLENLGNSCYMNSVLQILFSLETFLEKYLDNALIHLNNCNNEAHDCILCQVSKIMYGMHSGMYSNMLTRELPPTEEGKIEIEEYQAGIKPSSFKSLVGKDHPEFSTNRQQDAFEYMAYLLDKFEKFEKTMGMSPSLRSFEFDSESRLECLECSSVKYRTQRNWYLPLSIPNWQEKEKEGSAVTWDECLSKFLGHENVELNCSICNKQTIFLKSQRIANFPRYLVIMLERFVYDWVPKKLEIPFVFPTDNINIALLSRQHSKPGEKVIEDSEDITGESEKDIEFNQSDVNLLINNGVPELAAKHALHNTNHNVNMALMWFYDYIDDPILNMPLPKIKANSSKSNLNEEDIQTLISFGFNRNKAEGSLKKYNGNVEMAANHLFGNPNEVFEDEGAKKVLEDINKDRASFYNLYGNFI